MPGHQTQTHQKRNFDLIAEPHDFMSANMMQGGKLTSKNERAA
jgi:hypothetical protein